MPTGVYIRTKIIPRTIEWKEHISLGLMGRKLSKESIEKMRDAKLGKKLSEETKRKMGNARRGIKRSLETRMKISKAHKGQKKPWLIGKNNPSWKGGITPENKKRLNTLKWDEIRKEVYKRDLWKCVKCGKHCSNDIQCDHIVPWRIINEDKIENLQTLCKSCHLNKDRKYNFNQDRMAAFTIVDDRLYYPIGTHLFINSFRRFHPDVDLIIFRQDMIDKIFVKENINFYQAKPFFGEIVSNLGYKLVVNIDADTIIAGRLTEVFDNVDYEIGGAWNFNDYENAFFENITAEMYIQAGMVASTRLDFWKAWQKINRDAMKYIRKENDTLNLLVYNDPEIKKMKFKFFDKDRDYYGCKSLNRESEFYLEDKKVMCRGEQVKAYHWARGGRMPKLQFDRLPFPNDVANYLTYLGMYGQTIKIGSI
jgi:hypothetical protein